MVSSLVALTDLIIILATGCIIYWNYVGWSNANYEFYLIGILLTSALVVLAFSKTDTYRIPSISHPTGQIYKILGVLSVTLLLFLAIAFALKISDQYSRFWVFSWFLFCLPLLWIARYSFYYCFLYWAKAGKISRKVVIVGAGSQADKLLKKLKTEKYPWISVVAIFDERINRIGPSFHGIPVLGNLDNLLDYARKNTLDDIIITLPWTKNNRLEKIVRKLKELPVNIQLGLDTVNFLNSYPTLSFISKIPLLNLSHKPLEGGSYILKIVEDKVIGFILLMMLSPIMFLIALAVKLESPGPVFFCQKRFGFNNKQFTVLKFRTMYQSNIGNKGVEQAKKNDPRVTPLGNFLRQTSLDELPQLLNVLGGTMSIVGPRPHAVEHNYKYSKMIQGYFSRHRVKPGITGWAQVNGLRGETETVSKMAARVRYDIFYIENWSFLFDIRILFKTFYAVISQKNAY